MKNNIHTIVLSLIFLASSFNINAQNLLTTSPSFEEGSGTGPGTSLNGGSWARTNIGNATPVQNILYRKTGSPDPQHLTAYCEAVTPNEPTFNAPSTLQTTNSQNLTSTLVNGKTYRVSFFYQNTASHTLRVVIENSNGTGFDATRFIDITTEATTWTFASFNFTMNTTVLTDARLKIQFGANAGTSRIDNMRIEDVATLPVVLNNFNVQKNNSSVKLSWETATEINNNYFEIARSTDGIQYSTIGKVMSKETPNAYTFIDEKPIAGNSFYQLKQFDKDGKSSILGIKMVNNFKYSNISVLVYPNPTKNNFTIRLNVEETGKRELQIKSIDGKVVLQKTLNTIVGTNVFQINNTSITKGIYTVNIIGENSVDSYKLVIE